MGHDLELDGIMRDGPQPTVWTRVTSAIPDLGRSYLVRAEAVGPVYDVAFFNGTRKDGSLWWTLGNVDIDAKSITHWAEITEP